ncbi:hypothetical protein ACFO3O_01335 [Dokdonia ponticola]|uniref:SGNH/GDSL hydrolase family protein n=1 Tax=Dokdonia ponticola TaxID=2041041 RepID=A0ABV9HRP5_9FLAO
MKRFIKTLLSFGIFAILFFVVALYLWGNNSHPLLKSNVIYQKGTTGHLNSRLKEVKDIKNVDLLFLGSSSTYRGFDPRLFEANGFSSFNLGSSAQTPIQTKVLLKRYLESTNPKRIIYAMNPEVLSMDGVESALDLIANDTSDANSAKMAMTIHHVKVYNTFIFASLQQVFGQHMSYQKKSSKGIDTYISGGFVEREMKYFDPKTEKKLKTKDITVNYRKDQLKAFEDIINLIQARDIELILINAPVTSYAYNSYTLKQKKQFDDLMSSYADYIDFNTVLKLQDSLHFYDPYHLNQHGVELFNKKVIEIIKQ